MKISPLNNVNFKSGVMRNVPIRDLDNPLGCTKFDIDTSEIYKINERIIKVGDGLFSIELADDPKKFIALYNAMERYQGAKDLSVDYYTGDVTLS